MCEAVRLKQLYPSLNPDRISLPSPGWDLDHALEGTEVSRVTCHGSSTAVAVCSGAPCFDDATAAGPLNTTCLCPMSPFSSHESFELIAPDVGHLGGCAAYGLAINGEADDDDDDDDLAKGGACARQETSGALEGTPMREWVAAAVRSMTTAPRATRSKICRAWFA